MNVLVAEDEELLAENVCQFLSRIPEIQIQHVASARQALDLLEQSPFDLLISDLYLPDGFDKLWLLEILNLKVNPPIIVISSYQIPPQLDNNQALNIIAYFEKPFDLQKIYALVARLSQTN